MKMIIIMIMMLNKKTVELEEEMKSLGMQKPILYTVIDIGLHSKNTRVSVTRKRVHWGQTPIPGQRQPGNWSAFCRLDK